MAHDEKISLMLTGFCKITFSGNDVLFATDSKNEIWNLVVIVEATLDDSLAPTCHIQMLNQGLSVSEWHQNIRGTTINNRPYANTSFESSLSLRSRHILLD